MNTANIIFIIIGAIILLIGIAAFVNQNWARWINFPGGPKLKAIGSTTVGIILIIIGFIIEIPMK
jgi:hypothetical protein